MGFAMRMKLNDEIIKKDSIRSLYIIGRGDRIRNCRNTDDPVLSECERCARTGI